MPLPESQRYCDSILSPLPMVLIRKLAPSYSKWVAHLWFKIIWIQVIMIGNEIFDPYLTSKPLLEFKTIVM